MLLNRKKIDLAFNGFINDKDPNHRYSSYDYCYNYFNKWKDKSKLASNGNLEVSCLHLSFYLASWGMLRGSSFLLQKSLRYYIRIVEWLAYDCPDEVWSIDVNNYNNENMECLTYIYEELSKKFENSNSRKLVLVTKLMLGVFGNTPAFDNFFTQTFKKHFKSNPAFTSYNKKSLNAIYSFYQRNAEQIEKLRKRCYTYNFASGKKTNLLYTRAKVIDMIGFGYSFG